MTHLSFYFAGLESLKSHHALTKCRLNNARSEQDKSCYVSVQYDVASLLGESSHRLSFAVDVALVTFDMWRIHMVEKLTSSHFCQELERLRELPIYMLVRVLPDVFSVISCLRLTMY